MGTQTFVCAVAIGSLPVINLLSGDPRIYLPFWLFAIWSCVSCQYGFLPTCIAETFGAKHTGELLGMFVWCEAPASLLVVICTQFYKQLFGGWDGYCALIAACSFVSFLLSLFFKSNIDRKKIIAEYEERKQSAASGIN